MAQRHLIYTCAILALLSLTSAPAFAGVDDPIPVWDAEEPEPEEDIKAAKLPPWLRLDAEYRVRSLEVNPFELSGENVRETSWSQQRLRLDLELGRGEVVRIKTQFDVLEGVLFGDNGLFGQEPSSLYGVSLAIKRPGVTRTVVGLREGADPLDPNSYVPVVRATDPLRVNHLYADAILPFGILRVGRQPMAYGATLSAHQGTRINRWGVSTYPDIADRFLIATKLDEAYHAIASGGTHVADSSEERGLFLAYAYDLSKQGGIELGTFPLRQHNLALQWKVPKADWLGIDWRDIDVSQVIVRLRNDDYKTRIWGFPSRIAGTVGPVSVRLLTSIIRGESLEIAEGFAALSSKKALLQTIESTAFQAIVDVEAGPLTISIELDYASGDDDPRSETPLTQIGFTRDHNVGLLLFEHLLAFESARSAQVGIENLATLGFDSFPLTEVSTEGRFVNAKAIFPQLLIQMADSRRHKLHLRLGLLMAWPAAAGGVVDPIMTILAEDGNTVEDDAVNYHGGDPGGYYGTEVDVQLEWTFMNRFVWTLEGAMLFPGDSLQDANGDAVRSYLVENRLLFLF